MKILSNIKKNSVTLIACAKNEGPYLLEWICYHKAIGIDHILIASHDNMDGSEALLEELHHRKMIEYYDFTDRLPPDESVQIHMYKELTKMVQQRSLSQWTMALDIDEFFVLKKHKNIQSLLKKYENNVDAIAISWEMFNANNQVEMSTDLVVDRFTQIAIPLPNVKTIARTNKIKTWGSPHAPILYKDMRGKFIYTNGYKYKRNTLFNLPFYFSESATIHHYVTKSLKEFLVKKHRGGGTNFISKDANQKSTETRDLQFFYFMNFLQDRKKTDIKKTPAYAQLKSAINNIRDEKIVKIETDIYEKQFNFANALYEQHRQQKSPDLNLEKITKVITPNPSDIIKESYNRFYHRIEKTDVINILYSRSRSSSFLVNKIKSFLDKDEYFTYRVENRLASIDKMNRNIANIDLKKIKVIFSQHPIDKHLKLFPNKKIVPIILAQSPVTLVLDAYNKQLKDIVSHNPDKKKEYFRRYKNSNNFKSFVIQEADSIMKAHALTFSPYDNNKFMPNLLFSDRPIYKSTLDYKGKVICVDHHDEVSDFIHFICDFFSHGFEAKKILKRYNNFGEDTLINYKDSLFKENRFLEMRLAVYIREYLSMLYFLRVD